MDETLTAIKEGLKDYRVAELREMLNYYRVTMPPRATKKQLHDKLAACMLAHTLVLKKA